MAKVVVLPEVVVSIFPEPKLYINGAERTAAARACAQVALTRVGQLAGFTVRHLRFGFSQAVRSAKQRAAKWNS